MKKPQLRLTAARAGKLVEELPTKSRYRERAERLRAQLLTENGLIAVDAIEETLHWK